MTAVVVVLVSALVWALIILFNRTDFAQRQDPVIAARSMQAEGRMWATQLQVLLNGYHQEHGHFPEWEGLQQLIMEARGGHPQYYGFGTAQNDQTVQRLCPDCHLSTQSFKIMLYANLDHDEQLDVFVITPDLRSHVLDDLQNNQ
jgi:hypothetical protein